MCTILAATTHPASNKMVDTAMSCQRDPRLSRRSRRVGRSVRLDTGSTRGQARSAMWPPRAVFSSHQCDRFVWTIPSPLTRMTCVNQCDDLTMRLSRVCLNGRVPSSPSKGTLCMIGQMIFSPGPVSGHSNELQCQGTLARTRKAKPRATGLWRRRRAVDRTSHQYRYTRRQAGNKEGRQGNGEVRRTSPHSLRVGGGVMDAVLACIRARLAQPGSFATAQRRGSMVETKECGSVPAFLPLLDAIRKENPRVLVTCDNVKDPLICCMSIPDANGGEWIFTHRGGVAFCDNSGGCYPM